MTNNSCNRLSQLFEQLGIPTVDKSQDKGELMAYLAGIDLIKIQFENCFNQLFADTASGLGLSQLCEILKIDSTLSDDEKREKIIQGVSERYGSYNYGDFERALTAECPSLSAVSLDFYITINGGVMGEYDLLSKLGRILENYLPPCTVIGFSGTGFDFDYWDSTPYLFEDYDSFNLNFEFLEELE